MLLQPTSQHVPVQIQQNNIWATFHYRYNNDLLRYFADFEQVYAR